MSALVVNEKLDFNALKAFLDVTDGNLASHLTVLEKLEYIQVNKQFIGKKPNTTYEVTARGKKAFADHLNALEKLIRGVGE